MESKTNSQSWNEVNFALLLLIHSKSIKTYFKDFKHTITFAVTQSVESTSREGDKERERKKEEERRRGEGRDRERERERNAFIGLSE